MLRSKRRLLSLLLVLAVAVSMFSVRVTAESGYTYYGETVPVGQGTLAPVSEKWLRYVRSGNSGTAPSTLELSYLAESYQDNLSRQNTRIPASFDLRDYGKSTPVQDQGIFGVCWTFGTLGSAEATLAERFPNISLSKKHLAWFTYRGADEEEYFTLVYGPAEEFDPYDVGGNDNRAVACLAAWKGPVYTEDVPYDAEAVEETFRNKSEYHLQDAFYLPRGDFEYGMETPGASADTVKNIVMEYGAVSLSYCAESEYYNESTAASYCGQQMTANHEVLLMGWDDTYPRENFREDCRPEQDGAWLIKNSWGTEWGDDGYFWLSYEDASIEFGCYFNLEPADNYTKNYQYDTMGWTISAAADTFFSEEYASKTAYISNIFTAEDTEQLEAVSFYTTDAGTEYEIWIYTGVSNAEPTSGKLAFSGQKGREEYAGYHTVALDQAIPVTEGEQFSVVIKLTNPEYAYPIALESCLVPYGTMETISMGNGGESYYSIDGKGWNDVVSLSRNDLWGKFYVTNVCLKAFTNPIPEDGAPLRTVQFSLMEGPVAMGSLLELSGAEEIYYRIDDGDTRRYDRPVSLDRPCKVTAWSQKDGKQGTAVSRTYTQAYAQLSELWISQGANHSNFDLSEGETVFSLTLDHLTGGVKLRPRSSDTVRINGTTVASDSWSSEISVSVGGSVSVQVTCEAEGKIPVTYTVNLYRSALSYDTVNERVLYDSNAYLLKDMEGNLIENGAVITPYIVDQGEDDVTLQLISKDTGSIQYETVKQRRLAIASPIDYENSCTVYRYGPTNEIADNPEMENVERCSGEQICVVPGQQIYVRKFATETEFASKVVLISVSDTKPDAPTAAVEELGADHIIVEAIEGAQYRIVRTESGRIVMNLRNWAETAYTVEVRIKATDSAFASDISPVAAVTKAGVPITVQYLKGEQEVHRSVRYLAEGTHTNTAEAQVLDLFGYLLEEGQPEDVTVTVSKNGGVLTADKDTVTFRVCADVDPAEFSYTFYYWNVKGNLIQVGIQPFGQVGVLDTSLIPIPYGYQEIMAEEDESMLWQLPPELCYSSDFNSWFAYPEFIHVILEPMASVTVEFYSEDGLMTEESYELLFGEEGLQKIEVLPPEGYEAAGDTHFTVTVVRGEDGILRADPDRLTLEIHKAASTETTSPAETDKPAVTPKPPIADKTDKPHGDRQNAPNTGEKDGFFLWSVILVISGSMAVSLSEKSGRRTKRTH